MTTIQFPATIECLTLADLEAAIASFKLMCRPSRRGRPSLCGRRTFLFAGQQIDCWVGESCLGGGRWGMTCRVERDGKRVTLQQIAKAALA